MIHPDLMQELVRQRQHALLAAATPRRPRRRTLTIPKLSLGWLHEAVQPCLTPPLRPRPW